MQAESTARRVRAALHGRMVIDSTSVLLVWENPLYPQYYIPRGDVAARLEPTEEFTPAGGLGTAQRYDVVSPNGDRASGAAWSYEGIDELDDRIRFDWDALDTWFEEDEVVIVHPRSPYVRVDAIHSSRDVRVDLGRTTIAHSTRSVIVFETGVPVRFYLPPTDVRLDVIQPSDTTTSCPYKGHAEYVSAECNRKSFADVGWFYATPLHEVSTIAGMIAFHDEKCVVSVDGVRLGNDS